MNTDNKWQKCKVYLTDIEYIELYDKDKFRGEVKIQKVANGEYYCLFRFCGEPIYLNNHPFATIKQCKDFIKNYRSDIIKIGEYYNSIQNKLQSFHTKQEEGTIPMADY